MLSLTTGASIARKLTDRLFTLAVAGASSTAAFLRRPVMPQPD
jgi:hypothetical protein